ncbi:chromatin assembly factor 1 subunit A-like [Planococcus citri]|uniref:chromatin assembly factor 1 subunit A-like n=1 Tax=Planococcus citri TaxID=170843 RepID=UPI0031F9DA3E
MNGMPEQKLKQARLPFKSTTTRKTTIPEAGKKRKHEDDSENTPQPAYIDLTEEKERSRSPSNIDTADTGVKSNKVCIIRAESESANSHSNCTDVPKSNDSKPHDKCSLQKWFKPKKVPVTKDVRNVDERIEAKRDHTSTSIVTNEQDELMVTDDSASSRQLDAQKAGEGEDDGEDEDDDVSAVDDSVNLSIDVDVSENDGSFSKTESSAPDTPTSKLNVKKKLSAKQKMKREEIEMKRLEKERLRKEKEKKRLEEKEEKQRLKEEKERKRLAELEAKNEEKRQKEEDRKAKEDEKKRQKEEERKLKEEERKQKEEERRQKEEEKRQKDEQKRQKEEQERKLKEKTAAAFTNFFLPKNKEIPKEQPDSSDRIDCTTFMPFEVKENMRLASVHRVNVSAEALRLLDEILQKDETLPKESLYLAALKSEHYKPGKSDNTWPLNATEDDDDVMIVGDEHSLPAAEMPMRYRCKLIQFHENRRPAYRGTWRKQSKTVSGRTPFKHDEIFDYEVDSDEEWEDEPGEDLEGGSEDEKESEDDYEVDNEVFVPHGYLSDEEGQNDDGLDSSPKTNKLKLNVLERQFEEEMKEKTHKLKPRIFGCIWIENVVKSNEGVTNVENLLLTFRAVYNEQRTPFCVLSEANEVTPQNTPSLKAKPKNEFPDSLLPDLVKLAHGNKKNTKILAKEFHVYVLNKDPTLNLTLSCITNKLKEISTWVSNIACRLVSDEIRNQCGLNELSHAENSWKYMTIAEKPVCEKTPKPDPIEKCTQLLGSAAAPISPMLKEIPKNKSSIEKFVKVLTPEEKQMAFHENTSEKSDKPATCAPATSITAQKPKPKNDITKFIKFGTGVGKSVENESFKINSHQRQISIDLTADDSNPSDESSNRPTSEAVDSKNQTVAVESPAASKSTPNKPVNILVPRKVPRSAATANVLIPRKTPGQFAASANSTEMPPPKTFNFNEMKTQSNNTFTPKRLLDSLNKTDLPKTVNAFLPKRAKDVKNSENLKPVNVLTPRRANVAKHDSKITASPSCSKPVNILIPRRANDKDVKKIDAGDVRKDEPKTPDIRETKDIAQDDASSDFTLCIESNDAPDQEMCRESGGDTELEK